MFDTGDIEDGNDSQTELGENSDIEKPSKQTKSKRCEQCEVKPKQLILYTEYD